jgi:hypothetical protein
MARYLYRCSDGAPCYYIDEEGGSDPMLYALDGRWVGYITPDGTCACAPDGSPMFSIHEEYFYGANGTVLYRDEGELEPEELEPTAETFEPKPGS